MAFLPLRSNHGSLKDGLLSKELIGGLDGSSEEEEDESRSKGVLYYRIGLEQYLLRQHGERRSSTRSEKRTLTVEEMEKVHS